MKNITKETLRKWGACTEGYTRFNELFPEGSTLCVASEALIADGHLAWSNWLWTKCKKDTDYIEQTSVVVGDYGIASAGNRGTASAGCGGNASAGYRGTASAGDYGIASAGNRGIASAGCGGNASAGDYGTASADDYGIASAGCGGNASAGDYGTISIMYYCNETDRYKRKSGDIGENGLRPNTPYIVVDGEFFEKNKTIDNKQN